MMNNEDEVLRLQAQHITQREIAERLELPVSKVQYIVRKNTVSKKLSQFEDVSLKSLERLTTKVLTTLKTKSLDSESPSKLVDMLKTISQVRGLLKEQVPQETTSYKEVLETIMTDVIRERFGGQSQDDVPDELEAIPPKSLTSEGTEENISHT